MWVPLPDRHAYHAAPRGAMTVLAGRRRWCKMCLFRDWGVCWVLSIGFELLELSMGWLVPQVGYLGGGGGVGRGNGTHGCLGHTCSANLARRTRHSTATKVLLCVFAVAAGKACLRGLSSKKNGCRRRVYEEFACPAASIDWLGSRSALRSRRGMVPLTCLPSFRPPSIRRLMSLSIHSSIS